MLCSIVCNFVVDFFVEYSVFLFAVGSSILIRDLRGNSFTLRFDRNRTDINRHVRSQIYEKVRWTTVILQKDWENIFLKFINDSRKHVGLNPLPRAHYYPAQPDHLQPRQLEGFQRRF